MFFDHMRTGQNSSFGRNDKPTALAREGQILRLEVQNLKANLLQTFDKPGTKISEVIADVTNVNSLIAVEVISGFDLDLSNPAGCAAPNHLHVQQRSLDARHERNLCNLTD